MERDLPSIESICCIGSNLGLVAEISSLFNRNDYYFAVFNEPHFNKLVGENEFLRRSNTIARIKDVKVIYADIDEETNKKFSSRIPSHKIIEINNSVEIDSKLFEITKNCEGFLHYPSIINRQ
jgi:hypothetical protein